MYISHIPPRLVDTTVKGNLVIIVCLTLMLWEAVWGKDFDVESLILRTLNDLRIHFGQYLMYFLLLAQRKIKSENLSSIKINLEF